MALSDRERLEELLNRGLLSRQEFDAAIIRGGSESHSATSDQSRQVPNSAFGQGPGTPRSTSGSNVEREGPSGGSDAGGAGARSGIRRPLVVVASLSVLFVAAAFGLVRSLQGTSSVGEDSVAAPKSEVSLRQGGLGQYDWGAPQGEVLGWLTALFGEPDNSFDLRPFDCPNGIVLGVHWNSAADLSVSFTDDGLVGYSASRQSGESVVVLRGDAGIVPGSLVRDIYSAYPQAEFEIVQPPSGAISQTTLRFGTQRAFVTGTTSNESVQTLRGGLTWCEQPASDLVPDSGQSASDEEPATERPAVSETEPTQGHTAEALTFTTDGSTPVAFPDCLGLLGFCLGQPGEAITADYGLDSERYSSGDSLYRTWRTPAGDLVAETDEVDSIVALQVRLTETSPNARIAIADGLVLGEMTFGDVLDTYPNAYAELFFAEGAAFFSLTEVGGPEGSVSTRLSTAIDGGSPAGGGDAYRKLLESSDTEQVTPVVLDIFRDLLVTSVRVQYG